MSGKVMGVFFNGKEIVIEDKKIYLIDLSYREINELGKDEAIRRLQDWEQLCKQTLEKIKELKKFIEATEDF
ncbi:hypothetical protein [Persephonella sp.]